MWIVGSEVVDAAEVDEEAVVAAVRSEGVGPNETLMI
jgi:hypothetical protein